MNYDAIRSWLVDLANRNDGRLAATAVVEDAKSPDCPGHDCFTWDDAEAGRKRRIDEARALIRSMEITVKVEYRDLTMPMFVRDPTVHQMSQGYIRVPVLAQNEDASREACIAALKSAIGLFRRASALSVALGLGSEFDAMEKSLGGLFSTVRESQPGRA